MIHLCTFTKLIFLQNNISQKILFIAARTIQFPGVVFKVCIHIIVYHRHLKLYISMSKVPILIENIYISNHNDESKDKDDDESVWWWSSFIISSSSVRHQFIISSSSVHHQHIISSSSVNHQFIINSS